MTITVNINGKATRIRNRDDAEFWRNFCQNQADSWRRGNAEDRDKAWNVDIDKNLEIQCMWENAVQMMSDILDNF